MVFAVDERAIVGDLRFHDLAVIIAAGTALIAILLSFYLIMMHATHYTMPFEQKQSASPTPYTW